MVGVNSAVTVSKKQAKRSVHPMHAILRAFFGPLHKLKFKKKIAILSELVSADTRNWHLFLV